MGGYLENLVQRGFAVFPVSGKRPTTRNGFKDAVMNATHAATLFERHRGDGVAVATGLMSGGLLVVDVDDRKGGDDSLFLLEQQLGHRLPGSVRALTPSGGQHVYLRLPKGVIVPSSVDFRPGIDIRADGGYVVAPPSPGYEWDSGCHPDENPIADVPSVLLELLLQRSKKADAAGWDSGGFMLPMEIGEGGRDDTLTRFAGQLRRGGLDTETIFEMLQHVNEARCRPPLANRDLKRIARSIGSKPISMGDQSGAEFVETVHDDGVTPIPGFVEHGDLSERLREYSMLECTTTGFPLLDLRIGGGLWSTQTAIIVAPTGAGKTALALQIARNAAQRRPVIFWTMEMPVPFLAARWAAPAADEYYLDLVRDMDLHHKVIGGVPQSVSFYGGRKIDDLIRCIQRVHKQSGSEVTPLLIVDYLQKIPSKAEDRRQQISEVSEALRALAMKLSCPVLSISSASRAGVAMLRKALDHDPEDLVGLGKDAGEIEYDANTIITISLEATELEDGEDQPEWRDAIVTVAKGRFGPGEAHLSYRFNGKAGEWVELGYITKLGKNASRAEQAIVNALIEAGGTVRSKRALIAGIPMRRKQLFDAVDSLVQNGILDVDETTNTVTLVKRVIQ